MAQQETLQGNNLKDFSAEQKRYTISKLRALELQNNRDLKAYFRLLTAKENVVHFSNPPVDTEDLKRKLIRDRTHAYLAINQEGTVVGAGGINDAIEKTEHDHFLVKVAVHPEYQGRGLGRKLVSELTDIAFLTPAVMVGADGEQTERERIKLDAAVIRDIEGWDRMPRVLRSLGYRFVHFLPNQVTVRDYNTGIEALKPTERWEISRGDWEIRQSSKRSSN